MKDSTQIEILQIELKETKQLLEYKNETANAFMNQVKRLQIENQQLRDA